MPAFVRFRLLLPVGDVMPGKSQLYGGDFGLSTGDAVLRHFQMAPIRKTEVRRAFEAMLAAL